MKQFKYKINGKEYEVSVDEKEECIAEVTVNGKVYQVEMEKKVEEEAPKVSRPAVKATATASAKSSNAAGAVKSPLPGIVISIDVNVGDEVKKGQQVAVLEAMKMENSIAAPVSGKVASINVNSGDSVLEGVTLLVIE